MTNRTYLSHKKRVYLWQKQGGRCAICGCDLCGKKVEEDHIQSLEAGGDNELDNWQLICAVPCHRNKSIREAKLRAKVKRLRFGKPRKSAPMLGTKASGWKFKMDGRRERR